MSITSEGDEDLENKERHYITTEVFDFNGKRICVYCGEQTEVEWGDCEFYDTCNCDGVYKADEIESLKYQLEEIKAKIQDKYSRLRFMNRLEMAVKNEEAYPDEYIKQIREKLLESGFKKFEVLENE